jgi:acetyl-CoA carboxylase biotin carboxylase subunit
MQRALREYRVEGIQTNLNFFMEILEDSDFRNGQFDTGFIEKWMKNRTISEPPSQVEKDLAVLVAILAEIDISKAPTGLSEADDTRSVSLWKTTARRENLRH